jgi:Txe/YoeB family toxin of Txe-Axe toxin-antitoxin module
MQNMINETEAKQIALEYVKTKESGAQAEIKSIERQDMWVMETQTKESKGIQYANLTVSGRGEVKDYTRTTFQSVSTPERITSKLRGIFSRNKQEEN